MLLRYTRNWVRERRWRGRLPSDAEEMGGDGGQCGAEDDAEQADGNEGKGEERAGTAAMAARESQGKFWE
jgi:hypothetical protein